MATPATSASTAPPDGVLERAVHLLRIVAQDGPVGVRELARRSGLPTSTVGRLSTQLIDLGLLRRVGEGLATGPTVDELAATGAPLSLSQRLRPLLVELVTAFGESAAIAVDGGDSVLYLDHVESDAAVRVPSVAERRHAFHTVAPGLALMSHWSPERLKVTLRAEPLTAPTPHTVNDPAELTRRLDDLRRAGHVWALEELDLEVNGLATTISVTDEHDTVATVAVSVYGPSYRLSPTATPDAPTRLTSIVDRFVSRLG